MGKKIKKKYPVYFKEFKCIGGKCSDSCCIGWNIDIDKSTFKKYFKVQHLEMKKMFQKNVQNNQNCTSDDVDYGIVKLKKDKRCPFLDEENYCAIHSNLGEDYLSNVCTCFPRLTNKIDDYYEMSLDVACPEAARIILLQEEGIEFKESQESLGKHIISATINTKSKDVEGTPIKYFKEIRGFSIEIIKNRNFDLDKRVYILGDFINSLEDEFEGNYKNISKFIKSYDVNSSIDELEKSSLNYIIQMDFFKKMVKILNVSKEVESIRFKDYTKEMESGFDLNCEENLKNNSDKYIKAFEEYDNEFIKKHEYILENYLVNFIYNNMFPFNEIMSLFDTYFMLLIRYSFIRFYLVGMYLNNKSDSKENIVEFIQCFSKTTEHHRNYLINSLEYVKRKEFNNLEFSKLLL